MKQIKLHLLTLALVTGLIGLFLLAIEFTLCWLSHRTNSEKRDHVVASEYLPVKFKANYTGQMWGIPYSTNSYGFRDEPNFPANPGSGELRVFSMGDSIGFGVGLEAEENYCKVAEQQVRMWRPESRMHLINASGQGYSPSGYYSYLRNEGLRLNPSMIVIETELCNDLTDEALLYWELKAGDKYPTAVKGGRYAVAWDGSLLGTYSTGGYLWERTYTYTDFVRRILNLFNRISPSPLFSKTPGGTIYYSLGFDQFVLDQPRIEQGWNRLLTSLEAANVLCSSRQIPFLVLLMPSRYLFDESAPDHLALAKSLLDRAESEIRQRGIPCLNMRSTIADAGGSRVFFDFAHLTAEGNRAVGETLAEYLVKVLEEDLAEKQ